MQITSLYFQLISQLVWKVGFELRGTKAYEQASAIEKSIINHHKVSVDEDQERLPTFLLATLQPHKSRFISNSSSCTINELSKLLTSCITSIKNHAFKNCEKVYERSGKNPFWYIKIHVVGWLYWV